MRKVWIVVANSGQGRVFRAENVHKLVEIHDFVHVEIHMPDRDLLSDKAGRTNPSVGYRRSSYEPTTTEKTKERTHFSEEIATFLEEGCIKGEVEKIYLIADAPFLGFLRESLSKQVKLKIAGEVNKDLTTFTPEEIRKYLPEVL